MTAFLHYLWATFLDGDFANDWLTHIPRAYQNTASIIGYLLALIIGR